MGVDISPFIADAQKLEKETGIPASVTLGQIMLESGGSYAGGLSGLAYQGKNLFGVKAFSTWLGDKITMMTTEYIHGVKTSVPAQFRKYDSYYDSMLDHAKVLGASRYTKYFDKANTVDDFISGIAKGGYATDPSYASKLSGIISNNNLAKYDTGKYKFLGTGSLPQGTGNGSNEGSSDKVSFTTSIIEGVTRIVFILLCIIVGVFFFIQAFPQIPSPSIKVGL